MTREEHRRLIYAVGFATRNKRSGVLMLCSGPDCAGAEVYAPGLTVAAVTAAADAHIDQADDERRHAEAAPDPAEGEGHPA